MLTFAFVATFAAGYAASVFTWDKLHTWIVGAEEKASQLRARAKALMANVRNV